MDKDGRADQTAIIFQTTTRTDSRRRSQPLEACSMDPLGQMSLYSIHEGPSAPLVSMPLVNNAAATTQVRIGRKTRRKSSRRLRRTGRTAAELESRKSKISSWQAFDFGCNPETRLCSDWSAVLPPERQLPEVLPGTSKSQFEAHRFDGEAPQFH